MFITLAYNTLTTELHRNARYAETHPRQPLKGHQKPRAAAVSYRASVPAGPAGCWVALSYRALSPYGESLPLRITATHPILPKSILNSEFLILNWTFTFSAKERDSETGLSYFGSRYYSSDLSIWLSVDPQSDKYASLSPYVYCADNPVKLADPNGEEVTSPDGWIVNNTNKTLIWVNDMGGDMCQYVGGVVTSFKSRSDFINEYASDGYQIIIEDNTRPNLSTGTSSSQNSPSSTNDHSKSFLGAATNAYSGSASGWNSLSKSQQQKISYDLTKSLKSNGYSIQTRQIKGGINSFYSTNVTRSMYAFNATMDIADFAYSYNVLDGGRFGVNSSSSLGGSVGGWGGALIGGKLGITLGAPLGPYGSLVGGFIGGVAFGFWGSELGSKIGVDTYNSINKK